MANNVHTMSQLLESSNIPSFINGLSERIRNRIGKLTLAEAKEAAMKDVNNLESDLMEKIADLKKNINKATDPNKVTVISIFIQKIQVLITSMINAFIEFINKTWEKISDGITWVLEQINIIYEAIFT